MKTPVLSTWYRAGKGLDVEHDLRVLQYTAVRHTQEAVLRRWQAATVGYYHARRCLKIAMSVWVSDTAALSQRYKCLLTKTSHAETAGLRDVFFSAWKQPVNIRILAERRRFARALRFILQWRETTVYIRKARTSKNMLEVAQPLHLLQLQLAEMKAARQLLRSQWHRTRRMARYAHVLNTHVMQVLGAASPQPSPRSSLSRAYRARSPSPLLPVIRTKAGRGRECSGSRFRHRRHARCLPRPRVAAAPL